MRFAPAVAIVARVRDAVDDAIGVVRHEQRAVLGDRETHGAREVRGATIGEKAADERLDARRLSPGEADSDYFVARRRLAIPRASHRHERIAHELRRERAARIELELHGRRVSGVSEHHGLTALAPLLLGDATRGIGPGSQFAFTPDMRPAVLFRPHDAVELLGLLDHRRGNRCHGRNPKVRP